MKPRLSQKEVHRIVEEERRKRDSELDQYETCTFCGQRLEPPAGSSCIGPVPGHPARSHDVVKKQSPLIIVPNGVERTAGELTDNGAEYDDAPETMKLAASMLHKNCGCDMEENPSMDVRFGSEVDSKGNLVESATKRYETFHDKEPRRVVRLDSKHHIPSSVDLIGDALSVMYRTDKWYEDGDDVEYKHVHDQGVKVFEPRGAQNFGEPAKLPVERPKAIVLLGKHLGFFVKRADDGEIYECNPRKTYLFCSPSGNMLLVYHPKDGFLALMAGGRLRVEKDGIDG